MNVTLGEPMAVKQVELPKTRSAKEDERQQGMVASLKAEIELLKDLDHPNIVMYLGTDSVSPSTSVALTESFEQALRKHQNICPSSSNTFLVARLVESFELMARCAAFVLSLVYALING